MVFYASKIGEYLFIHIYMSVYRYIIFLQLYSVMFHAKTRVYFPRCNAVHEKHWNESAQYCNTWIAVNNQHGFIRSRIGSRALQISPPRPLNWSTMPSTHSYSNQPLHFNSNPLNNINCWNWLETVYYFTGHKTIILGEKIWTSLNSLWEKSWIQFYVVFSLTALERCRTIKACWNV